MPTVPQSNWLANGQKQRYPITIDGKSVHLDAEQIGEIIKKKLKSLRMMHHVFKDFEMSPDCIDDLKIEITDLEGKYAETDGECMRLNSMLFEDGDFLEKNFFVVPHEIVHFLSRKKEEKSYMNDPEERLAFVLSVAYEMECGLSLDVIWNKIYPKVKWHFHNEIDARTFFKSMVEKAREILH